MKKQRPMRLSDSRDARRAVETLYTWLTEERHHLLLECLADENSEYTTPKDIIEELEKVLQEFKNHLEMLDVCFTHYNDTGGITIDND